MLRDLKSAVERQAPDDIDRIVAEVEDLLFYVQQG